MTDSELLDYLQSQAGAVLVSDDQGNWAMVMTGLNGIVERPSHEVDLTVNVQPGCWRDNVRGAVEAYKEEDKI